MTAHRNNFDGLRLAAALLVVYGHQLQLKHLAIPLPLGVSLSKTGLDIFFSLSGYLVTNSWERQPRLMPFLRKRALRIFPALIAIVLLTIFAFGPAVTDLGLRSYVTHVGTWRYLSNIGLYLDNQLPGVFANRPDRAVNGSLWSLCPEFMCYLALPLLGRLPASLRIGTSLSMAACAATLGYWLVDHTTLRPSLYGVDLRFALLEVPFFLVGSSLRIADGGNGGLYRIDIAILLCLARAILAGHYATFGMYADVAILPYLIVGFGRASLPVWRAASRYGDLSYGLYLYAFPIQQIWIAHADRHALPLILLNTAAMAWLSWHLIERPALRLKPRGFAAATD